MGNIFLFYGEEKYDLDQSIEKIKKSFNNLQVGLNLFYIQKDNIEELSSILQGVSFFGEEKLVIIKDTKLKFNVELLNDVDEKIKVIIVEDTVDKRTSEFKKISKIAECKEFKFLDQKGMLQYIMQLLKKYNINISSDTASYMQMVCGLDKANNINELQKLVIYLNPGDTVTEEIIDTVCSKTLNSKIFDLLDMIVNKDKKRAILKLDEILKQKEPIVKIYIMLYKQVKQLYMIKYLKEKNESDIASKIGIHPFVYKNLSQAVNKYTLDSLKNIIYKFDEYDENTKNGQMDFEIGLKKIICLM